MKILIAGLGYVGQALARILREDHEIHGIKRSRIEYEKVTVHAVNLADTASLSALPRQFDALFYLVAAEAGTPEAYEKAYIKGNKNLHQHLKANLPKRSVFVSSTSVYHQNDAAQVSEQSPTRPDTFRGQTMLQAEEFFSSHYPESSIVRAAGIYGPGRTRLLETIAHGSARLSGQYTNRIHRDDLAGLLAWLLGVSAASTKIVNAVDNQPVTRRQLVTELAQKLGVSFNFKEGPSTPGGKRVDNSLVTSLGFQLKYPGYQQGYEQVIEEFKNSQAI